MKLREIGTTGVYWWSKKPATAYRASYVMKKMMAAENTVEKLEAANAEMKRLLAKTD